MLVNSDLIKFVEQSPDTVITLITGEKMLVREDGKEILARVVEFRRSVLREIGCSWDPGVILSELRRRDANGAAEAGKR
jgi:flagellar protein FlbD